MASGIGKNFGKTVARPPDPAILYRDFERMMATPDFQRVADVQLKLHVCLRSGRHSEAGEAATLNRFVPHRPGGVSLEPLK